jgi:hypothetical protein
VLRPAISPGLRAAMLVALAWAIVGAIWLAIAPARRDSLAA